MLFFLVGGVLPRRPDPFQGGMDFSSDLGGELEPLRPYLLVTGIKGCLTQPVMPTEVSCGSIEPIRAQRNAVTIVRPGRVGKFPPAGPYLGVYRPAFVRSDSASATVCID